jgi:hypothetical protein
MSYKPPVGHNSWLSYFLATGRVPGVITAEAAIPAPWIKDEAARQAAALTKALNRAIVRIRILETDPKGYVAQYMKDSQ